ncbi:hypothetical protein HDU76_012580 [Blyttiomyces sp. JEL0837]|nr:hypothetical protein HDU76_012580 [Blyttiomyces sp. JEL0837]
MSPGSVIAIPRPLEEHQELDGSTSLFEISHIGSGFFFAVFVFVLHAFGLCLAIGALVTFINITVKYFSVKKEVSKINTTPPEDCENVKTTQKSTPIYQSSMESQSDDINKKISESSKTKVSIAGENQHRVSDTKLNPPENNITTTQSQNSIKDHKLDQHDKSASADAPHKSKPATQPKPQLGSESGSVPTVEVKKGECGDVGNNVSAGIRYGTLNASREKSMLESLKHYKSPLGNVRKVDDKLETAPTTSETPINANTVATVEEVVSKVSSKVGLDDRKNDSATKQAPVKVPSTSHNKSKDSVTKRALIKVSSTSTTATENNVMIASKVKSTSPQYSAFGTKGTAAMESGRNVSTVSDALQKSLRYKVLVKSIYRSPILSQLLETSTTPTSPSHSVVNSVNDLSTFRATSQQPKRKQDVNTITQISAPVPANETVTPPAVAKSSKDGFKSKMACEISRPHAWELPYDATYKNPPPRSPPTSAKVHPVSSSAAANAAPIKTSLVDDEEPIIRSLAPKDRVSNAPAGGDRVVSAVILRPHAWELPPDATYKNPPPRSPPLSPRVNPVSSCAGSSDAPIKVSLLDEEEEIIMSLSPKDQLSTAPAGDDHVVSPVSHSNTIASPKASMLREVPNVIQKRVAPFPFYIHTQYQGFHQGQAITHEPTDKFSVEELRELLNSIWEQIGIKKGGDDDNMMDVDKTGIPVPKMLEVINVCKEREEDKQMSAKSYWTTINRKRERRKAKVAAMKVEAKEEAAIKARNTAKSSKLASFTKIKEVTTGSHHSLVPYKKSLSGMSAHQKHIQLVHGCFQCAKVSTRTEGLRQHEKRKAIQTQVIQQQQQQQWLIWQQQQHQLYFQQQQQFYFQQQQQHYKQQQQPMHGQQQVPSMQEQSLPQIQAMPTLQQVVPASQPLNIPSQMVNSATPVFGFSAPPTSFANTVSPPTSTQTSHPFSQHVAPVAPFILPTSQATSNMALPTPTHSATVFASAPMQPAPQSVAAPFPSQPVVIAQSSSVVAPTLITPAPGQPIMSSAQSTGRPNVHVLRQAKPLEASDYDSDWDQSVPANPPPLSIKGRNGPMPLNWFTIANQAQAQQSQTLFQGAVNLIMTEFGMIKNNGTIDPAAMVANEGCQVAFVATSDGRVLGAVVYRILRNCVYVDALVAADDFTGQGIGAALLERVKEIARARNKAKVTQYCHRDAQRWFMRSSNKFVSVPAPGFVHPKKGTFMKFVLAK